MVKRKLTREEGLKKVELATQRAFWALKLGTKESRIKKSTGFLKGLRRIGRGFSER